MQDMWLEILFGLVACEAMVHLWFEGGPLQPLRSMLTRWTPALSYKGKHVFECKDCMSVWIALLLTILLFVDRIAYDCCVVWVTFLSIYRLSNHFHLVFSLYRDRQVDLRVERNYRLRKDKEEQKNGKYGEQ